MWGVLERFRSDREAEEERFDSDGGCEQSCERLQSDEMKLRLKNWCKGCCYGRV